MGPKKLTTSSNPMSFFTKKQPGKWIPKGQAAATMAAKGIPVGEPSNTSNNIATIDKSEKKGQRVENEVPCIDLSDLVLDITEKCDPRLAHGSIGDHVLPVKMVFPGNDLTDFITSWYPVGTSMKQVPIGPGLFKDHSKGTILVRSAGVLCLNRFHNAPYVQHFGRGYRLNKGDRIVGMIRERRGTKIRVKVTQSKRKDIRCDLMDHPGISKKTCTTESKFGTMMAIVNQPYVRGFCRLEWWLPKGLPTPRGRESVGFISPQYLHYGYCLRLPNHYVRMLLRGEMRLVQKVGTKLKIEVSLGVNGMVQLSARNMHAIHFLARILRAGSISYLSSFVTNNMNTYFMGPRCPDVEDGMKAIAGSDDHTKGIHQIKYLVPSRVHMKGIEDMDVDGDTNKDKDATNWIVGGDVNPNKDCYRMLHRVSEWTDSYQSQEWMMDNDTRLNPRGKPNIPAPTKMGQTTWNKPRPTATK